MRQTIIPDASFEPFYSPYESSQILIKADPKDPWTIFLEASNEDIDSQDDVVMRKALEEETENFLKSGVISWDHLHKSEKSPEFIVGEPLDVKFKEKSTWVKAKLYKSVKMAQAIKDMLESGSSRLGSSIGGFIQRREKLGKSASAILKVIWDEVAITYKPVNKNTLGNVSMIPMGAFAKALMAGSGVNAANFSGGRALTTESLAGNTTDINSLVEEFSWRLKSGDILTPDDLKDFLKLHGVEKYYGTFSKVLTNKFGG